MGNNSAFSNFEGVIIVLHNHGVLDKKLLGAISAEFMDQDADSGGYSGTLAKDKKDLLEIVASLSGRPVPNKPKVPKDYNKWTEEQDADMDSYRDKMWDIFHETTKLRD